MKNKKRLSFFLFFFSLVFAAVAQDFPTASNTLVTDYTNSLSSAEIQQLERKLVAFDDSTSTQIAVVLINSTGDYDIADYAVRLAQKWGIGNKKYNNGVLLLAAIGDRAVTIQTGYGIEGALPDAIAYRIIENDIKPAFRTANYFQGLNAATSSIIAYTKGEYKAEPKSSTSSNGNSGGRFGGVVVIIVILIIVSIISKGGGRNGGRKVIGGKGSSDLFWWMLLSGLGGGSRGDSDRGGGFGGGFGGDGGGFGGFGGGGFGGGGASGRW